MNNVDQYRDHYSSPAQVVKTLSALRGITSVTFGPSAKSDEVVAIGVSGPTPAEMAAMRPDMEKMAFKVDYGMGPAKVSRTQPKFEASGEGMQQVYPPLPSEASKALSPQDIRELLEPLAPTQLNVHVEGLAGAQKYLEDPAAFRASLDPLLRDANIRIELAG